jgi:hypothetical protein
MCVLIPEYHTSRGALQMLCTPSHTIPAIGTAHYWWERFRKKRKTRFDFVSVTRCYDQEFGGIARCQRRLLPPNAAIWRNLEQATTSSNHSLTDYEGEDAHGSKGWYQRLRPHWPQRLRAALGNPEIDFVAVNDLTSPATLAHLLKYDSILGNLKNEVTAGEDFISVDGKKIKVFSERDPAKLDWASVGAQIVVESTGFFTDGAKAKAHLGATVKKVIISAPATNEDITLVLGVNQDKYDAAKHNIISNASCTTNCLAPVVKVILETTGLVSGIMTTIHSYTNDQVILDTRTRTCAAPAPLLFHDSQLYRRRQGSQAGHPGDRWQAGRLRHPRPTP